MRRQPSCTSFQIEPAPRPGVEPGSPRQKRGMTSAPPSGPAVVGDGQRKARELNFPLHKGESTVVALRVELSTTRLSAASGQPALDYRLSRDGGSNPPLRLETTRPSNRSTIGPSRRAPSTQSHGGVGAHFPRVGRAVLESASAAFQAAADQPSVGARISATDPNKKARCRCDTGLSVFSDEQRRPGSHAQWIGGDGICRLTGKPVSPSASFVTEPYRSHGNLLERGSPPRAAAGDLSYRRC